MLSALLSFWTHMLAAVLFAALTLWRLRNAGEARGGYVVVAGLGATAFWAWIVAIEGPAAGAAHPSLAPLAETVRNLVWLGFLFMLAGGGIADARATGARIVFASMAAIVGLQLALDVVPLLAALPAGVAAAVASTAVVLRITAAAGALVLVHNVYGQATADTRGLIRLPMLGLAALWAYDLNLYTIAYLFDRWPPEWAAMRGAAAAAAMPLFALVRRRRDDWRIELSRVATFQSLSLGAICAYFVVMTIGTGAGEALSAGEAGGWGWLRAVQISLLGVMTVATAVLIPSVRARAWLRVTLTKHLFKHRYDYRAEWLRFTQVMGAGGPEAAPVGERVLKAIADIVEAPAGLLLVPGDGGRFDVAARFDWDDGLRSGAEDAVFAAILSTNNGRIVDFAALREGRAAPKDLGPLPAAMLADARIWAGVPLIHDNRLTGLALLSAPPTARALDWEDFDLLRTAARGAASYLAEARGQEALSQSARFDEFNRRFAFILHDIKNLVSGLTLVARNAERHAENPEFRADMVATLRSSVERMNDLLARLSPQEGAQEGAQEGGQREAVRDMALTPLLNRVVAAKRRRHDVRVIGGADLVVVADPQRLEQALIHLIDNAIDASTDAPVRVEVGSDGREIVIAVIDHGAGMSADFVRRDLFQPFASTKPGGFGVGAHQARALVTGMGGHLTVDSREGTGTRFDVRLPAAAARELAA